MHNPQRSRLSNFLSRLFLSSLFLSVHRYIKLYIKVLLVIVGFYGGIALAQSPTIHNTLQQLGVLALMPHMGEATTRVATGAPRAQENSGEITAAANWNVPQKYAYKGMIYAADGKPFTGIYNIRINIHDNVVDHVGLLWSDLFEGVLVLDGFFEVVLGSHTPLGDVLDGTPRYIGIQVNDGAEIVPRERLHPVPWAAMADVAQTSMVAVQADTANVAFNATNALTATFTSVLPPLNSAEYTVANHINPTPASTALSMWQTYPSSTICGLSDIFNTTAAVGDLYTDCRIDAATKTLHAGRNSYCQAICMRLSVN